MADIETLTVRRSDRVKKVSLFKAYCREHGLVISNTLADLCEAFVLEDAKRRGVKLPSLREADENE